jgi:hypothetical protein
MLNRLRDVFRSFHENDVRYLVIGGIAAVLHGVPRATFDLDILIEPAFDNAERLIRALLDAGLASAELTNAPDILAHEITVFNDIVRVDVQTSTPGLCFEEAWARRQIMDYHGQPISVASREDLIASKRAAGRAVDLEDARLLELPDDGKSPPAG